MAPRRAICIQLPVTCEAVSDHCRSQNQPAQQLWTCILDQASQPNQDIGYICYSRDSIRGWLIVKRLARRPESNLAGRDGS
jgi:hypothetical protein